MQISNYNKSTPLYCNIKVVAEAEEVAVLILLCKGILKNMSELKKNPYPSPVFSLKARGKFNTIQ